MTDAELRDAAWKELELTTVGWDRAGKYAPARLAKTHWGKAKALLDQIGTTPAPVVTPPLLDMRATKVTALPSSGLAGQETPADAFKTLTYQNSDITLVDDPRWKRAFRVHMHQNATWDASSHNPWFKTQVPNSGELICGYNLVDGAEIWTAGSVKLMTPFNAISRADGWAIIAQLDYEGVSPPAAVEVSAEGIGLDLDGGMFNTTTWRGQTHQRLNFRPLSEATGQWCDFLLGVRWTMSNTGWVSFQTRTEGTAWVEHYTAVNVPTAQALGDTEWKEGGYFGRFGASNPVGWECSYLLRGLTLHSSFDDAVAALQ